MIKMEALMSIQRLFSIVRKEFIHIKRDKASLIMALIMPILFILIFGYAVNTDVENIKLAVFDYDKTEISRDFIGKFSASNYFNVSNYTDNLKDIDNLVKEDKIKAALILPSGFSKNIKRGVSSSAQFIIDGSDPTIARTALQSSILLSKAYSLKYQGTNYNPIIDFRTKVWFNPALESTRFTIPALIGLIMQNITILLTAFTLVREKERGTLEQLQVTPIRSSELILGKMIPYILIGSVDFLIALFFGTFWFGVPIQGNVLLLIILGFGFVICALAMGMLVSSIASNQLQAMQMSLLLLLPSVLLSGFIFPRDAMPFPINQVGNIIPLTYFINILRGIILKGVSLHYLYSDVLILGLLGVILLALAIFRFKKILD
jgi:ABC-2 type transport system permease protein